MFCPKCGAQNPDGAGFCGNCGERFEQRQAPAPTPMPQPTAGAAIPAAGKAGGLQNPKLVGIIAGVVVLVLLIVLVRLFACSGGNPNMVDVVSKPSNEVANILKGQKETTAYGEKIYTNNEEFLNACVAVVGDADSYADKLKKYDGCYMFSVSDNSGSLSLEKVQDGSKPSQASYATVVVAKSLTAKDVADRVNKIAPYEKVYVSASSGGEYFSGAAKGNGCVSSISVAGKDGVYLLSVTTYSITDSSSGSRYSEDFDDDYSRFDASNYSDSYKK